jgi:hypothetical protein
MLPNQFLVTKLIPCSNSIQLPTCVQRNLFLSGLLGAVDLKIICAVLSLLATSEEKLVGRIY